MIATVKILAVQSRPWLQYIHNKQCYKIFFCKNGIIISAMVTTITFVVNTYGMGNFKLDTYEKNPSLVLYMG